MQLRDGLLQWLITQTKQESQKGAWKDKIGEDINRRHSGTLEKNWPYLN